MREESKSLAVGWVCKTGWYSEAVRTGLGGAAGIRQVGSCCGACGLVGDSRPDRQAWPKQRLQWHPFSGEKDTAESAVPGSTGQLPKRSQRKIS